MSEFYATAFPHTVYSEIVVVEFNDLHRLNHRPSDFLRQRASLFEIINSRWLESMYPPLLVLDLTLTSECNQWLLKELHSYVHARDGQICYCDRNQKIGQRLKFLPKDCAASQEEAVEKLLSLRKPLIRDDDPQTVFKSNFVAQAHFSLVGCPERDYVDLPERFVSLGLNIRAPNIVCDDDFVVFCMSCTDGPTSGTKHAVAQCAGRTITPLAIVLTNYTLVNDDSLRNCATVEEMELLCQILSLEQVDELPLLYDFDPGLVTKIASRIPGSPMATCKPSIPYKDEGIPDSKFDSSQSIPEETKKGPVVANVPVIRIAPVSHQMRGKRKRWWHLW